MSDSDIIHSPDPRTAQGMKDFMEWFVLEYDGRWLPSDFQHAIDRLDGYVLAKRDTPEKNLLEECLSTMRDFQTLLRSIKQYTDWKYRA